MPDDASEKLLRGKTRIETTQDNLRKLGLLEINESVVKELKQLEPKNRRSPLPIPTVDPEYSDEEKAFKTRLEEYEQKFKFSQEAAEAKEKTLALHSAVYFMDFEAIEALLKKPTIKIDAKNEDGKTVFDLICSLPFTIPTRENIVSLLIKEYEGIQENENIARAKIAKAITELEPAYYLSGTTRNSPLHKE